MGRAGLPPITKLEEVLDLILDPAKYRKYLIEFKEIYDQTKVALGVLATKEQADIYLSNALNEQNSAIKERADAEIMSKDARAEQASVQNELRVLRATIAKEKEQVGHASAKFDEERAAFAKHVTEVESTIAERKNEAARQLVVLNEKLAVVEAKRAKLANALKE